jgi:PRTRC genetic system protein C
MARIFIYDGKEYTDPDPNRSVDEIRQDLANIAFPELSNAETKETKRGEDKVFTFMKRTGTKGSDPPISIREVPGSSTSVKYIEFMVENESSEGDVALLKKAYEWLSNNLSYTLLGVNITNIEDDCVHKKVLMVFVEI